MKRIVTILSLLALLAGGQAMGEQAESKQEALAIFAGGCFWCLQPPFDKEPGVLETVVGYTGGTVKDPTYE